MNRKNQAVPNLIGYRLYPIYPDSPVRAGGGACTGDFLIRHASCLGKDDHGGSCTVGAQIVLLREIFFLVVSFHTLRRSLAAFTRDLSSGKDLICI